MDGSDNETGGPEPAPLRRLRLLVTTLTLTLILGMVTITGLLAWRLTSGPSGPALPEAIALPPGETLTSYAISPDWTILLTRDTTGQDRLHLIPAGQTAITQTVPITGR